MCRTHQMLSGGLWQRMSGGHLVVTNQWTTYHLGSCSRNAFPHKKCQLKCWGHFFLFETVLSTLWWKLIEITDSVEMHPFYQDIYLPGAQRFLSHDFDRWEMKTFSWEIFSLIAHACWHDIVYLPASPTTQKKKDNTLLPKYITCSNISQNWARREPLKANIALYAVQKGKQKQR